MKSLNLIFFFSIALLLGAFTPVAFSQPSLLSRGQFEQMLKHRNEASCPANGFYSCDAFVAAANTFPGFATAGDVTTKKREIAAFLAQPPMKQLDGGPVHQMVQMHGDTAINRNEVILEIIATKVQTGLALQGRNTSAEDPFKLHTTTTMGLLENLDLVATDPTISFKTALWFWMTPHGGQAIVHNVITGKWTPSGAHRAAGRVPGYGLSTNIINGGLECGNGRDARVDGRIGNSKRYCKILGVSYGNNLDCTNKKPFNM